MAALRRVRGLLFSALACADALQGAGARTVRGVCVARAGAAVMSASPDGRIGGSLAVTTRRGLSLSLAAALLAPAAAWASGGATAGKFTSIPIAKRRYYGRVQEAVYEFLLLDPRSKASDDKVSDFFGENVLVRKARIKSNCIGPDSVCKSDERKTSRWDDMQLTMFLLGNAFRIDSSKSPDRIPQVQMARKFFAEVKVFKEALAKADDADAQIRFASACKLLDTYLDQVDLPPSSYEVYKTPFDIKAKKLCAGGNFCI
ncbi:hypothetical protein T492DRAFT_624565 [Pavlovales sp. CCMP2436]|nr:hypothetical protein T492DRAFT_624565 [Pavlovales sp. CCMP2436]